MVCLQFWTRYQQTRDQKMDQKLKPSVRRLRMQFCHTLLRLNEQSSPMTRGLNNPPPKNCNQENSVNPGKRESYLSFTSCVILLRGWARWNLEMCLDLMRWLCTYVYLLKQKGKVVLNGWFCYDNYYGIQIIILNWQLGVCCSWWEEENQDRSCSNIIVHTPLRKSTAHFF